MNRISCIVLGLFAVGAASAETPRFDAIQIAEHIYDGEWEHFVGGGVAVFDCDGNGLPELFVAGGENPAVLFRNTSEPSGALSFETDTPAELRLTSVIGSYPIDIDNDSITDLVILRVGKNILLKGEGQCQFFPFEELGIKSSEKWTTSFSATWEDGQRLPTLAFGNYVDRENPDGPFGACDENLLYQPEGEKYKTPTALAPAYCPLSMLFSDWAHTGEVGLRISNDRHYYVSGGQEQMWQMRPKVQLYGESDGWVNHQLWGMGIASRDISGNGVPEVMMTSMGDQRLQRKLDKTNGPTFEDVPFKMGTTAHRPYTGGDGRPSTGWHVEFGDVQNDGLDDIFIAKGNVEQMPGLAMKDPNNLLVQTLDGQFVEFGAVAGLDSMHRGRGAALSDLNSDGLLDIVVVNRRAPLEVFQNVTQNAGNWIAVRLEQKGFNISAIGAWIELKIGEKTVWRELTIGGGHAGGRLGAEHFGLGAADAVSIRVNWPDRSRSGWVDLTANKSYVLRRNGGTIEVKN